MYVAVTYTKTFDECQHGKIKQVLTDMGLDGEDIRTITHYTGDKRRELGFEYMQTDFIDIKKGVRRATYSPLSC